MSATACFNIFSSLPAALACVHAASAAAFRPQPLDITAVTWRVHPGVGALRRSRNRWELAVGRAPPPWRLAA